LPKFLASDQDQGDLPQTLQKGKRGGRRIDIVSLLEVVDEASLAALFGLLTGAVFGVAAQRSQFCQRAATVEFARGSLRPKVSVWLTELSTALIWVQGARLLGLFRVEEARMMAVAGSWSEAGWPWRGGVRGAFWSWQQPETCGRSYRG
jgi:hypothetical protein